MAPRFTSLNDWLAWQESLHSSEIELGLDRIRGVAERLGLLEFANVQHGPKVITVAGTNGKGSCVKALEALLLAQGYRVGAYTSPHIHRYNERLRLDSENVNDELLCDAFARIDEARGDISLTYFEFGTLAALVIFADQTLDYWLLEVGLGGRLDGVNIIDPDIAIITSIALDHEAWLGSTREAIGREKAGICRADRPLICADPNPPESISTIVQNLPCDAFWLNDSFRFVIEENCERGESDTLGETLIFEGQGPTAKSPEGTFSYRYTGQTIELPAQSVAAALQALGILGCLPDDEQWDKAASTLCLQGRYQKGEIDGFECRLDVAHNPAAIALLFERLQRDYSNRPMVVVMAMMADKAIDDVIALMASSVTTSEMVVVCAGLPDMTRAATPETLLDAWNSYYSGTSDVEALDRSRVKIVKAPTVTEALVLASDYAHSIKAAATSGALEPLIVVMGSFFTVAEALGHEKVRT